MSKEKIETKRDNRDNLVADLRDGNRKISKYADYL